MAAACKSGEKCAGCVCVAVKPWEWSGSDVQSARNRPARFKAFGHAWSPLIGVVEMTRPVGRRTQLMFDITPASTSELFIHTSPGRRHPESGFLVCNRRRKNTPPTAIDFGWANPPYNTSAGQPATELATSIQIIRCCTQPCCCCPLSNKVQNSSEVDDFMGYHALKYRKSN